VGCNNLIINKERVVELKKNNKKMEKLKDIKYLLFAYHHATTIIFYRVEKNPQPLVDLM
jgi:hypothetical protein